MRKVFQLWKSYLQTNEQKQLGQDHYHPKLSQHKV